MPENLNPHVRDMLSWHSHAAGGVSVPFRQRGNPLGQLIETPLVLRLRALATSIAGNADSRPRWIFLVGGPGNGKSETVQEFLVSLDASLGMQGTLVDSLRKKYNQSGLLPRKVEITTSDIAGNSTPFAAAIGRLIVVQDATATDSSAGNAAKELADDIADLVTHPTRPPMPVFIACANRGLLSRSMYEAVRAFGDDNEVTKRIAALIQAASLGLDTLSGAKPCWPLEADDRFACWPLDVESLLAGDRASPFEIILTKAAADEHWEASGRCADCDSRERCPFRQNSEWLRDSGTATNLRKLLRRGELARGQRWNFRDVFSLAAELLVGQWSDFESYQSPCAWVHEKRKEVLGQATSTSARFALANHLYPQAMFPGESSRAAVRAFLGRLSAGSGNRPQTISLLKQHVSGAGYASAKPIREVLSRDYSRLDPASATPRDAGHILRKLEDAFCQSIEQGRFEFAKAGHSPIEDSLLERFEVAEQEWDLLGKESAIAATAVYLLRRLAAAIAKRSVGARFGFHALDELLVDYEASLHDVARLSFLRTAIQPLVEDSYQSFNLIEILGQPTAEARPRISLKGSITGIRCIPAPSATNVTAGHEIPCIEFAGLNYRVPLTFDFFMALRLRREGCAGSSLPANVRAALDRVRHRSAGTLCRADEYFADGRASIQLWTGQQISLTAPGANPELSGD